MSEPTELLPCPFCGEAVTLTGEPHGEFGISHPGFGNNCPIKAGNGMKGYSFKEDVIRVWNQRATPAAPESAQPPQAGAEDAECEHNHLGGYSPLVDATPKPTNKMRQTITLRFIVIRKQRTYGNYSETYHTTTDVGQLTVWLCSGGMSSDGDADHYELVNVEIVKTESHE